MRTTFSRLPWRELPPVFAEILRPRIEEIGSAMVQAIRREVPAYHRPLDSPTGRDLVTSVHRAMHQFAELTEDPDGSQRHYEHFFQRLGRREFLNGRTTDGLQAACRVGARGAHIGRLMAERTLAPLRELPSGKAARLAETLDALLTSWGRTAPEVADALRIHPQTARNRLRRLDELFGDRLADPSFRIEALLALRTRAMRPPGPAE
ncbi:helix-turn-helix domain-containing protein [Streptomyces sp. NPDC018031]|uniref:PucR family transcriptional regulator n=1 Tax=Streptomyces sp. NPDC018031 TaxID=3365033 RepID=UPI0037877399